MTWWSVFASELHDLSMTTDECYILDPNDWLGWPPLLDDLEHGHIHISGTDQSNANMTLIRIPTPDSVPEDAECRRLNGQELFPGLYFDVVNELSVTLLDRLHSCLPSEGPMHSQEETCEFILEKVYGLNPNVITKDDVISILKKRRSAYPPILINHLGNKFSFSLDSVSAPLNDVVEISAALPENLDWLDVGDNKWMELRTYLAEHEGLGRLINSAWLEDSNSMEVLTQLQPLFENAFSQRHRLSRDVISWPVTVDRIADRLRNGVHLSSNVRVLLVVLDCCSLPMGTLLLDYLRDSDLQLNRETATLAMEPTLSSISRKSIAAGSQPDESFEPLHSTAPENKLWKKYWRNHFDNTVRTHRIVMAERKQKELREHISNPHSAALFVVFNELDKLVHASCNVRSLRYSDMRNMAGRWMSDELVPFLKEATDHGWRIVITSDHGCTKITRRLKQDIKDRTLDQTARSVDIREMGERVIWPHENFISVLDEIEGRKIEVVGHPCLMLPAGMVSPRGSPFGFAHGGLSLEEILVPYIELGAW